jgi:DNA transformation protein and related proteins
MPTRAQDPPFIAHCLELLAAAGTPRARRMFGGHGLYVDELFIAIVADERLYLKVDDATRSAFSGAGGQPFVYEGKGTPMTMSYFSPPAEALDSPALMAPWARLAMEAALRAGGRVAGSRKSTPRRGAVKPRRPRSAPG